MTLEEFYKATEGMPEDAEIFAYDSVNNWHWGTLEVNMLNTSHGKEIILKLGY